MFPIKSRWMILAGAAWLLLTAAPAHPAVAPDAGWREWAPAGSPGPVDATNLWLRAWLRVPDNMAGMSGPDLWRDSMTVTLADLPGPVQLSLNGTVIVDTRDLGGPRRFKVPRGSFVRGAFNAVVLRLDGTKATNGLRVPPAFAGYFDEVRLERPWELRAGAAPESAELVARTNRPGRAAYTEADFHPSTTVMQASPEPVRGQFVSPAEALRRLRPADDLIVEELLHEPEVAQPTQFSFDARGRLWVAQYRQYPYPAGVRMISRDKYYRSKYDRIPPAPPHHTPGADVISVHEDRDGDGRYETHRRVLTGLNMANAVVTGHGGIWVMHTPYLLFYPDRDGDDVPDGPPEVRLQGFGLEDTHSVANGLAWGPDGWLYGAQGSTTTSRVTRPGVDPPGAPGVYVEGCMVWRYHPQRRHYEIFADGSGNTFGVSFDAEGRLFTGHNGGDTRGWHHVQNGQYLKQGKDPGKFGPPPNPYAFGELPMMRSTHPVPRFTHMTLVVEGTAMPGRWRGQFAGADPLHHDLVAAQRAREGSTFVTTDTGRLLQTDDLTFRPVYLANAPDGSLLVADFREEFIAHGQNYQSQIDPDTGRIYRLRGRTLPLERDVDLARKAPAELVAVLSHPNPWHRQTAVRLLAERRDASVVPALSTLLARTEVHPALEALWVLHQLGRLDASLARVALEHPAAPVRAWVIRLLGDERTLPPEFAGRVAAKVASEPDAEVRCQVLSTARQLPASQSLPLVRAVSLRTDDLRDPFIPLMAWFAVEALCAADREAVLALWNEPEFWSAPLVREHLTARLMRRLASAGSRQELVACARLMERAPSTTDRQVLLDGFEAAFRGREIPPLPDELTQALAGAGKLTLRLRVRRQEPAALAEALAQSQDSRAPVPQRVEAIRLLGEVRHPAAGPVFLGLVATNAPVPVRVAACGALLAYDDPGFGSNLVRVWPGLPPEVRITAINVLASRPAWMRSLVAGVASGSLPRAAIPGDVIERLRRQPDPELASLVARQFPAQRVVGRAEFRPRIDEVRRILAGGAGDAYRGEPLFNSRCGVCHTLFFKGGRIGPDLTAYQRDDLGTLLVSVIDPNAEIREGYENQVVVTRDGRTLNGFLADQDARVIVLRGFDGTDLTVPRAEVESLTPAGLSLMPEGMLDGLSDTELRDLFAYLRQSQPIVR